MKISNQDSTPMQIRKPLSTRLCGLAIFVLAASLWPVHAQTIEGSTKPAGPSSDNVSQEITLTGNVSRVLTKGAPGMIAGGHLLSKPPAGIVDASLGRFGRGGNGALSVASICCPAATDSKLRRLES